MSVKLIKCGQGTGLLIPAFAARSCGLKPGSLVRILVLENEIRVKLVSAAASVPPADGVESYEDYQERQAKLEAPQKWWFCEVEIRLAHGAEAGTESRSV